MGSHIFLSPKKFTGPELGPELGPRFVNTRCLDCCIIMCLRSKPCTFIDGRFVVIFDTCKQCHSSLILKGIIKPMDLLYFATSLQNELSE